MVAGRTSRWAGKDVSPRWCISIATASAYTMNRVHGCELLVAQKFDSAGSTWSTGVDHENRSAGPSTKKYSPGTNRNPDVDVKDICPGRARIQGTSNRRAYDPKVGAWSSFRPIMSAWNLRAVPNRVHGGPALCGAATLTHVPDAEPATAAWAITLPGIRRRARSSGPSPEAFSRYGRAPLTTAGDVSFYGHARGIHQGGEHEGRQGTVEVQDALRDHRQTWFHVLVQREAVRWRGIRASAAGAGYRPWRQGLTESHEGLGAVGGYKEFGQVHGLLGGVAIRLLRCPIRACPAAPPAPT